MRRFKKFSRKFTSRFKSNTIVITDKKDKVKGAWEDQSKEAKELFKVTQKSVEHMRSVGSKRIKRKTAELNELVNSGYQLESNINKMEPVRSIIATLFNKLIFLATVGLFVFSLFAMQGKVLSNFPMGGEMRPMWAVIAVLSGIYLFIHITGSIKLKFTYTPTGKTYRIFSIRGQILMRKLHIKQRAELNKVTTKVNERIVELFKDELGITENPRIEDMIDLANRVEEKYIEEEPEQKGFIGSQFRG